MLQDGISDLIVRDAVLCVDICLNPHVLGVFGVNMICLGWHLEEGWYMILCLTVQGLELAALALLLRQLRGSGKG